MVYRQQKYIFYHVIISNAAPGMTFTKVMDFYIIDFLLPEPENEVQSDKTKKHMDYNARQPHIP